MLELLLYANRIAFCAFLTSIPLLCGWLYLSLHQNTALKPTFTPFKELNTTQCPPHAYSKIADSLLQLPIHALKLSLPDLRQELILVGKNDRPDTGGSGSTFYLSFRGSSETLQLQPGTKLFLNRNKGTGKYCQSSTPTSLWLEGSCLNNGVSIHVGMKSIDGEMIGTPKEAAEFTLNETPLPSSQSSIEIGKYRMDTSLFARQRARWIGQDLFLQQHGGSEYSHLERKERIEFGESDTLYACYAAEGDCLVWKNERWQEAKSGEETIGHFLLQVKKIEERLMHFTLWDPQGKAKINLTLVKPSDPPLLTRVVEEFKYIGARSLRQWIFELRSQRVCVKANDWWLLAEKGWIKLKTPSDIDDYVQRTLNGYLFIVEGMIKKSGQQNLIGSLYNPTRTHVETIELPISHTAASPSMAMPSKPSSEQASLPGHRIQPPSQETAQETPTEHPSRREEEEFYRKELEAGQKMLKKPQSTRGTP